MYLVIGAGLAGLSAALTLQEAGTEVTVLDSSDRAGGRVASDLIDGFTLDRGFQLLNLNYPEVKRLGIERDLNFKEAPRSVCISFDSKYVNLGDPRRNFFSVFSSKSGSLTSKILFLKYLTSTPLQLESVEAHLLRCGTADLYQKVLKPFLQGVFLADPARVSAVVGREIIGNFISGRSGIPSEGVSALPATMAKRVKTLHLNTRVEEIREGSVITNKGEFLAKKIIVATDLTTAGQLLGSDQVTPLLSSITWYHATNNAPTSDARLVLDSQNRGPVVNSIVISNLSSKYAPNGQSLISSTTISHASESEVRRHLALMWGANTGDWRFLAKYEIHSALPLFAPGSERAKSLRVSENIYRAGDYLTAPSQNGALLAGRLA
ncbi:MAG: FAD-dependent oxidoreductase, partial [Actinobacteria bacterium]|nr:FAD-dependent oxidoreductase [Actinomycetota bacterium]